MVLGCSFSCRSVAGSLALVSAILLWIWGTPTYGQNGGLDGGFGPPLLSNTAGGMRVLAVAESGGKILVAGDFDTVDGQPAGRLLRLLPNGAADPTFIPGAGANAAIRCMLILSNQKILIGGDFTQYDGIQRGRIARLNSDGTLDTGFNPGSGFDGPVHCLQTQFQIPSNYFVGGNFSNYNGTPRANLALLNSSGVVSTSFASGTNGPVYAMSSGSSLPAFSTLLIGGDFSMAGGSLRNRLAGFATNGSLMSFNSGLGLGPNGIVRSIERLDSSSAVWIGGSFSHYSGWSRQNLAILDTSSSSLGGITDYLNSAPIAAMDGPVHAMAALDSFSMFVGGAFSTLGSLQKNKFGVLRSFSFGSASAWGVDTTYSTGTGPDGDVLTVRRTSDGKALIGGGFQTVNGTPRSGIARLLGSAGSSPPAVPQGFLAEAVSNSEIMGLWNSVSNATGYLVESSSDGVSGWTTLADVSTNRAVVSGLAAGTNRHVRVRAYNSNGNGESSATISTATAAVPWDGAGRADPAIPVVDVPVLDACAVAPDGSLIVAGAFSRSNLPATVVRYLANGTLDLSFNVGSMSIGSGYTLAIDPFGKIYVGGTFTSVGGFARDSLVRLLPNGAVDPSFDHGPGSTDQPLDLGLQHSGKLIVAGSDTFAGRITGDLIRLNQDGSLDRSFTGLVDRLSGMKVLSDDRILIWGSSMVVNGKAAQDVAVLTADGQIDPSFTPVDVSGTVNDAISLPGGKWLIAGSITAVWGVPTKGIARLSGDGTLDQSFSLPESPNQSVSSVVVQPDGKLVIIGSFSSIGSRIFRGIVRVHSNGAIDDDFRPGSAFSAASILYKVVQLPDLRICVVGQFDTYAGGSYRGLAFIMGDVPPSQAPSANGLSVQATADAGSLLTWTAATQAFDYLVQSSANGSSAWQTVKTVEFGTLATVMPYPQSASPVFYRVVARNHAGETPGNVVPAVSNDAYLAWRIREGGGANRQSLSDDDGDGVPLLLEYAFAMNPHAHDRSGLPEVAMVGNNLSILFEEVRPDVAYEVETSTDLIDWKTEGVSVFRSTYSIGWVPVEPGTKRFLRIRVAR